MDPMSIFDRVTISAAVTDGKSYLGYDDSNSICFLEVTAPGETTPQVLSQKLIDLEKGGEVQFSLASYYEKPGLQLEFVVMEPEDDTVATMLF